MSKEKLTAEELKQAEVTAEEFIRGKVREKYAIPETLEMFELWVYDVTAEESLRWAHEFAALKVAEAKDENREMLLGEDYELLAERI